MVCGVPVCECVIAKGCMCVRWGGDIFGYWIGIREINFVHICMKTGVVDKMRFTQIFRLNRSKLCSICVGFFFLAKSRLVANETGRQMSIKMDRQ